MILDELTYRSEIDQPLTVEQADRNIELLEEVANNKPYYIRIIITGTVNATSVSSAINALEFGYNIDEIRAPVVIRVVSGALTYIYFYRQGKGTLGGSDTTTAADFTLISIINTTVDSVDPDNPATPINDLGIINDGDYISVLNEDSWDLTDAGDIITVDGQDYQKTYYFTYTDDGVLYLIQFVGAAGEYGVGGTPFEADDFVATSNSGVEPVAAPIRQAGQYYFLSKGWNPDTGVKNEGAPGEIGDLYSGTPTNYSYVSLAIFLALEDEDLLNNDNFKALSFTELNQE